MKTLMTVILSLALLLQSAWAEQTSTTTTNQSPWSLASGSFETVWASKYLAFGGGGVIYDKGTIQSELAFNLRNGCYAGLWSSMPFTGFDKNFGTEIDLFLGWNGPLSKLGVGGKLSDITLDIGVAYYDEPHLATLGADDVVNTHIRLTKAFKPLSVYVAWDSYVTMPGSFYTGGHLITVGASKSACFFKDKLSASTSLDVVYDTGGFGLDDGFLLKGNGELGYKLTRHLTATASVTYYVPLNLHDSREVDKVVFLGFKYGF